MEYEIPHESARWIFSRLRFGPICVVSSFTWQFVLIEFECIECIQDANWHEMSISVHQSFFVCRSNDAIDPSAINGNRFGSYHSCVLVFFLHFGLWYNIKDTSGRSESNRIVSFFLAYNVCTNETRIRVINMFLYGTSFDYRLQFRRGCTKK